MREGKLWAKRLLEGIEINADHILIGIDSYSSNDLRRPHVELSVIYSHDELHCTGKIYPDDQLGERFDKRQCRITLLGA